jgi:chromosome partitioning protein
VTENVQFPRLLEKKLAGLVSLMALFRRSYDFIFLDSPSRLDSPTSVALAVADSYLVPILCEYASLGTIGNVLRAALEVRKDHNSMLKIFGCLLTMADRRARFSINVVREVRQYLKGHVFRTIIPRDPRVAEVPYRQAPVIVYDIESPGAKAYIRLAREILGERSFS